MPQQCKIREPTLNLLVLTKVNLLRVWQITDLSNRRAFQQYRMVLISNLSIRIFIGRLFLLGILSNGVSLITKV